MNKYTNSQELRVQLKNLYYSCLMSSASIYSVKRRNDKEETGVMCIRKEKLAKKTFMAYLLRRHRTNASDL